MINLIKLTQNFFEKINETNKQNNYNRNTVELSAEDESEDTLPWYWFGSETQLREDYDYTSLKTEPSIKTPQDSLNYLPESATI
ncbi:MAG: hypothetical protein AAGJ08_06725 [Cyanobacteria bacterium P01_H01_bin.35]